MAELQDITGVGPAREDDLAEAGYESVEDLAEADPDQLSEDVSVSDDKALDFVVQAQNLLEDEEMSPGEERAVEAVEDNVESDEFDLTPKEASEEVEMSPGEEQAVEAVEDVAVESDDAEPSPNVEGAVDAAEDVAVDDDSDEPETYSVELTFDNKQQYDVFHAALMRKHEDVYTSNQPSADALRHCLDELDSFEAFDADLTERELNELHSAVLQTRTRYQGENLIDQMDALEVVERQVNEQRNEYLFD